MGEQQSSIDRLPEDIREKLQELLRDPRVTQLDATARINQVLEEEGLEERLSKSAVNRYKIRMDKIGKRLRQSRQVADMWIAKMGAQPQGKLGHLINEILRTLSFDMTMVLAEGELNAENAPAVAGVLKDLSLAMQRLEKASTDNVKREAEIRRQALEEAAEQVNSEVKHRGLSDEAANAIKAKILGIAAR